VISGKAIVDIDCLSFFLGYCINVGSSSKSLLSLSLNKWSDIYEQFWISNMAPYFYTSIIGFITTVSYKVLTWTYFLTFKKSCMNSSDGGTTSAIMWAFESIVFGTDIWSF
jgi:hypothetical protein